MIQKKVWEKTGIQMPTDGWSFSFVPSGNKLYAIGGMNQSAYFADTRVYDFDTGAWSEKQPLPGSSRMGVVCVRNQEKIYAVGGITRSGTLSNEFAEYDISADTWTVKESLHPIFQPALLSLGDDIYICGGVDEYSGWQARGYSKALYKYNVKTGSIEQKADMAAGMLGNANMCFYNGTIVCFGENFDGKAIYQKYDIAEDRWTLSEDMPPRDESRVGCTAQIGETAYLIARKTYRFSLRDGTWTEMDAGPLLQTAVPTVCAVMDRRIIAGGDLNNASRDLFALAPAEEDTLHILLREGAAASLSGLILPEGIEADDLIWKTDDSGIASVTQNGTVTGVGPGTAEISAEASDGSFEASIMVLVADRHLEGLIFTILLKPGAKQHLVSAADGLVSTARWESSNEDVARINRYGYVTAAAEGMALITMTGQSGNQSHVCVTVRA